MRRRDFITVISGAAAGWPFAARAQQTNMPVIGFLSFRSANESAGSEAAFREGLSEIGYSEGRSVHIAFRWAEGQKDRLPVLASDLVDNLRVAVIAATGGGPSFGAHLPTMYATRSPFVDGGGLMAYGSNNADLFRRAGDYVDKILRGAKPGDIPVEQPTKFDLVINLTTAKAIGLTLPESFLQRANELIE